MLLHRRRGDRARARVLAQAALLAAALTGCTQIRVRIMEARPARSPGCAVAVLPGETGPRYDAFSDVAYAEVRCRKRERCVDELRKQACVVGATAVYWSWEETRDGQTEIDAHFAVPVARSSDLEIWPAGGCVR
jgi:hypothetical protein